MVSQSLRDRHKKHFRLTTAQHSTGQGRTGQGRTGQGKPQQGTMSSVAHLHHGILRILVTSLPVNLNNRIENEH
jgi:hypothetical protein